MIGRAVHNLGLKLDLCLVDVFQGRSRAGQRGHGGGHRRKVLVDLANHEPQGMIWYGMVRKSIETRLRSRPVPIATAVFVYPKNFHDKVQRICAYSFRSVDLLQDASLEVHDSAAKHPNAVFWG